MPLRAFTGGPQQGDDRVHVVDASPPDTSTGMHQRGPKTSVVGKGGMGPEIGTRRPHLQPACAFVRAEALVLFAHQVDGPGQLLAWSMMISIWSPSCSLPMAPPASASGEICPMQAPVETPLKRASVSSATCLPVGSHLSAEVI